MKIYKLNCVESYLRLSLTNDDVRFLCQHQWLCHCVYSSNNDSCKRTVSDMYQQGQITNSSKPVHGLFRPEVTIVKHNLLLYLELFQTAQKLPLYLRGYSFFIEKKQWNCHGDAFWGWQF